MQLQKALFPVIALTVGCVAGGNGMGEPYE